MLPFVELWFPHIAHIFIHLPIWHHFSLLSSWNPCYFSSQWVTRKMMHNLFFPKHFLDHFYFLGLFAICLSLDDTGSHESFSKGDSFTLTLLRPLVLAGVQTFLCSLLMLPDHFSSVFLKNTRLWILYY